MSEPSRLSSLPLIDEHSLAIPASIESVWDALERTLERSFSGAAAERFARVVGCAEGSVSGPLEPGSTVVGFRVASIEPHRRLVLEGRHRFSVYRLTLELDPNGEQATVLRAITHATFPGIGRVYRAAVIGSGAHKLVVRRMLRHVARSAA